MDDVKDYPPYIDYPKQIKTTTNADRIRAMSDDEMAKCIFEIGFDCHLCSENERLSDNPLLRNEKCDEKCTEHCLEWLQQPEEGE